MHILMLLVPVIGILVFFGLVVDHSNPAELTRRQRIRLVLGNLSSDTGAWSASGGFRQFFTDYFNNTNAFWTPALPNLNLETHKGALFGSAVTPDFDATAANSAYNAGTWTTGNESSGSGYTAAGTLVLNTALSSVAGGITMWDADDLAWTTVTVTALGLFIHADSLSSPVAKQGICAIYFGGTFQTTAGNFTVQFSASGVYRDDNA